MAKYFVIIDDIREGPYSLDELTGIGLRPTSYVWTKSMDDWQQAKDVPEICRLFRQYLGGVLPEKHGVPDNAATASGKDRRISCDVRNPAEEEEVANGVRFRGFGAPQGPPPDFTDYDVPPANLFPLAFVSMLLCCPLTGIVATYYSWRANSLWKATSNPDLNPEELGALRRRSHEAARRCRMWIGFTLCISLIIAGFLMTHQ